MIVRDDDRVDARQVPEFDGVGVQPLWTHLLARRHPIAPDRIDQDAHPVDFEQRRGVPEPGDVQSVQCHGRWLADQRHRPAGDTVGTPR